MSNQDYEASIEWVQRTLANDPQNIDARIILARLFMQSQNYDDARDIVKSMLQEDINGWTDAQKQELADIQQTLGLTTEITPVMQMVRDILGQKVSNTEKVKLLNIYAAAAFSMKEYGDTAILLEEALYLDENSDLTRRNMAMLLLADGHREEAQIMANAMDQADFVLLYLLQERENG